MNIKQVIHKQQNKLSEYGEKRPVTQLSIGRLKVQSQHKSFILGWNYAVRDWCTQGWAIAFRKCFTIKQPSNKEN